MPPDKVMGVYRAVSVSSSGPVSLRHPAGGHEAAERVAGHRRADGQGVRAQRRHGRRRGASRRPDRAIVFEKRVPLAAGESREVTFTPAEVPQLVVHDPKLWWPAQYGTPTLHRLELTATAGGHLSDRHPGFLGVREADLGLALGGVDRDAAGDMPLGVVGPAERAGGSPIRPLSQPNAMLVPLPNGTEMTVMALAPLLFGPVSPLRP